MRVEHLAVVVRIDDHRDAGVVLGGRADHRRPADVDVLDAVGERGALRHGRLERIEIDHQQIDGRDAVRVCSGRVLGIVADGQKAAVHLGMQRLEPAVHHLGKAGVLGHVLHGEAGVLQRLGGAAGGEDLHAARRQRLGEFDEPGLVGDRDQGPPDHSISHGSRPSLPKPRLHARRLAWIAAEKQARRSRRLVA